MDKRIDTEPLHNNIVLSYQEDLQENDTKWVNPMLTSSPTGKQKDIVQSSEKCFIDGDIGGKYKTNLLVYEPNLAETELRLSLYKYMCDRQKQLQEEIKLPFIYRWILSL